MKEAEKILDKHLKLNNWHMDIRKESNLYNTLIDAMNEALYISRFVVTKRTLCLCGQPELTQYSPYCSLKCWNDQFD